MPEMVGCASGSQEIGVIEYEDAPDTETEYALLDAVSADRETATA